MTIRIFGVGLGIFIIVFLWMVAGFLSFVLAKTKKPLSYAGPAAIGAALFFTVFLLILPREKDDSPDVVVVSPSEEEQFDYYFIWRTTIVILMGISCIGGVAAVLVTHWSQPLLAKPLLQQPHPALGTNIRTKKSK